MSIITRFMCAVTEPEFKLARDLIAMAIADGEVTTEEKEAMRVICLSEGIDEAQLLDALQGGYEHVNEEMPNSRQEKEEYLRNLIRLIGADDYCSPQELYLFQIIASKMGLNQMNVVGVFLISTTHRFFQGDTGVKVLASFLKNVVDPKGKKNEDNIDNLRTMYETIADCTEWNDEKETYRQVLLQNLQRATEMLLENKILETEYRHIGVNFANLLKGLEISVYEEYTSF